MEAPSGEISWALFLEYIEGPTLREYMDETCIGGVFDDELFTKINEIVSLRIPGLQSLILTIRSLLLFSINVHPQAQHCAVTSIARTDFRRFELSATTDGETKPCNQGVVQFLGLFSRKYVASSYLFFCIFGSESILSSLNVFSIIYHELCGPVPV